jgi:mono/diheme cytochrome c family protein
VERLGHGVLLCRTRQRRELARWVDGGNRHELSKLAASAVLNWRELKVPLTSVRCGRTSHFFYLATIGLTLFVPGVSDAQVKPPDPSTIRVAATSGAQVYAMTCAACHQTNGAGLPAQFPPLGPSEFVTGDEQRLIHIVLRGLTGEVEVEGEMFKGEMPGWAPALNDAQVAAVLTYVRQSFGNKATPITAETVAKVRTASAQRQKPYTAAELSNLVTSRRP